MSMLRALWAGWAHVAHTIGRLQTQMLLSLFYYVVVGPFAVGARILSDPLQLGRARPRTWAKRVTFEGDPLTVARRQF